MSVEKINDLVERHELAFVILRTTAGKENEPQGAQELGQYLSQGFNPFSITFWMEAHKTTNIMSGTPPPPTMYEKIWMKRTSLVKLDEVPPNPKLG